MPKINRYTDIDEVEKEAKKDYIDRHSPFIHCDDIATKGEIFKVTIKMGNEYTHPDDFDHFIANIALYNGDTLLARADFVPGTYGGEKSNATVTFDIRPMGNKLNLTAQAYCTKHGVWESTPKIVTIN